MGALKRELGAFIRRFGKLLPDKYPEDIHFYKDPVRQIFFGYYDVSPFQNSGDMLLATRTGLGNESPHRSLPGLEVGYYNGSSDFQAIATTSCWNWQQGCRLQWMPSQRDRVLFNDFDSGRLIARIYDIQEKKIVQNLSMPVYAISPLGDYALGLDFSRLHVCRPGYGYSNACDGQFDQAVAVYNIDLDDGAFSPLISYAAIHKALGSTGPQEQEYVNHLSVSPDGVRFIFFYVTLARGKRQTYLMTANKNGGDVRHVMEHMRPSHYAWRSGNDVLITAQAPDNSLSYGLVSLNSGSVTLLHHSGLRHDGHPSFIDNECFISDTYPSRTGQQTVFIFDMTTGKRRDIASFYLPPEFAGEKRCDLHPRLSPDGKRICIDVVQNGRRCMAVMPVAGAGR